MYVIQKKTVVPLLILLLIVSSCQNENTSKQFTLLAPSRTSITFTNKVEETKEFNVLKYGYLYNGGGVSIGDINNDGLSDIYFTGNMVGSHLYLNKGDFEFEEIAKEAGVFAEGLWNTGTTMADVNADGFLDIYVCRSAAQAPSKRKNLLFINNGLSASSGQPTFTEKAEEFGIADSGYSTQGAFFDYDKDGDLDLYVLNHSTQEYAGFGQITASLKNRKNEAYSDKLYRNDEGTFKEVGKEAGLTSNVLGFGLGVAISDLNNDGWPDIYISNDYNEQDYLYMNNADGTFSESLETYIGHTSLFSMGSDIADINNDGFTDIMTLDMLPEGNQRQKMVSGPDNYNKYQMLVNAGFYNQTMRNMLQLNNGGNSFSEIGQFSGISNTDWSWASLFADFNNDGYKDVFITNGYKRDYTNMDFMNFAVQKKLEENKTGKQTAVMELIQEIPSTVVENYTYENNGDLTFTKRNTDWGLDQESLSNGAAYADLDNDGDLDLVVNNLEQAAFIYKNNSESLAKNNYLKINLKGDGANTFGIGAKVIVQVGEKKIVQECMPTRGYQSSVDYPLVFGLGKTDSIADVTVHWSDTKEQTIRDVQLNQTLLLEQKNAINQNEKALTSKPTYFIDISQDSLIPFIHRENSFVDFNREQLLPHKVSTLGPKIAKADINDDGLEDLFIGGAKGSPGSLFVQKREGKFLESNASVFQKDALSEDVGALFFDADGDNDMDLYVVSGGSDYDINSPELQDRLYVNDGTGNFTKKEGSLPEMFVSGSCITAADFDGDGDNDLFVGGRLIPGMYPKAPRSYVLKNDGKGQFTDVTTDINKVLLTPGMVTDALWTDFDGDTKDDLIIIGEWMAIRMFKNVDGLLEEVTQESGTANSHGWWNVITPADFDNDGDMDYMLGNFGLNSQLKASQNEPVELYVKDFDGNGSLDPIMCSYILGESYPVFSKDDLVGQLSGLKTRYNNYSDYSNQKITDIFTKEQLSDVAILKATTFASSYMENLGNGKFRMAPLPAKTQFSPVYGMVAMDIDGDTNLDVTMGGNFFGNRVKYGRSDASKGDLLLGNGKGEFKVASNTTSGLNVKGEVRDVEIIAANDNQSLLVLVTNNGPIKIYTLKTDYKN